MQTLFNRRYKASHLRMSVQERGNSHSYGSSNISGFVETKESRKEKEF